MDGLQLIQSLSHVQLFATQWTAAYQASLSPTPEAYSNSCPWSWWCHPIISPSVIPFSSCLQSFPASGSFLISQFFTSGGQSIGTSASAPVFPMNIQDWLTLGLTGLISFLSKGLSRVFSNTTVQEHQLFGAQLSLWSNSHIHTGYWKTIALTRQTFLDKVMSLLFNMLSSWSQCFFREQVSFNFHGCSHHLQWFWSPQNKVSHCFHCFPIYFPGSDGTRSHDLSFLNAEF